MVTGDLHLPAQWEHVGDQSRRRQHVRGDFLRLGMRLRLVQNGGEVLEHANKDGGADLVHRDGHEMSP